MATYKADHLKEMIRQVVREEIRGAIAQTISEVFAERYLKQLVESAAAAQPRGVNHLDIQGDDEVDDEEVPHPLRNSILGVGQENPVFKKVPKSAGVRQFSEGKDDERNEMLSMFFEGTRLIPTDDSEGMPEGVAIPVEKPEVKALTETWTALAQGMERDAARKKPPVDPAAEEARLKKLRESLERRVG